MGRVIPGIAEADGPGRLTAFALLVFGGRSIHPTISENGEASTDAPAAGALARLLRGQVPKISVVMAAIAALAKKMAGPSTTKKDIPLWSSTAKIVL